MTEPTERALSDAQAINLNGEGNADRRRIALALDAWRRKGIEEAAAICPERREYMETCSDYVDACDDLEELILALADKEPSP